MRSVKLADLKKNPSGTLRKARKTPVVVTVDDHPEAIIFHLDGDGVLTEKKLRLAVVTGLFADGDFSLEEAAEAARMPIAKFVKHLVTSAFPPSLGLRRTLIATLRFCVNGPRRPGRRRSYNPSRSNSRRVVLAPANLRACRAHFAPESYQGVMRRAKNR